MYGEGDERYLPTLLKIGHKFGGKLPKLVGVGGKQQLTYVGNAAWAHVCAKNALGDNGRKIGGLPVFVTDDSPILDTIRFCQRLSAASPSAGTTVPERAHIRLRPTWWSVPAFLSYLIALLVEVVIRLVSPFVTVQLDFPPRGLISYLSSILMYSRLRAALHLDYEPKYGEEEALARSVAWYERWYEAYQKQMDKDRWINNET